MHDDSRLPTRLLTLGLALFVFGLGCHFWADRVYRVAGLAIGAVQMCRCLLTVRISKTNDISQKHLLRLRTFDHVTAVLLITALMHAVTTVPI